MDYEGFFKHRLNALRAEGGATAFSPTSSGAAFPRV
jgi:hypothetical protein